MILQLTANVLETLFEITPSHSYDPVECSVAFRFESTLLNFSPISRVTVSVGGTVQRPPGTINKGSPFMLPLVLSGGSIFRNRGLTTITAKISAREP